MADIELVIKIPKELYEKCKRMGDARDTLFESIRNGIVLPEMHGRLIDADAYVKKYDTNINGNIDGKYVFAPTIIEANKGE